MDDTSPLRVVNAVIAPLPIATSAPIGSTEFGIDSQPRDNSAEGQAGAANGGDGHADHGFGSRGFGV